MSDNRFKAIELNIAKQEPVDQLPEAVDGIINNAGIIQPFNMVNNLSIDKINRVFSVNFFGTLYLTKAFLPHFLQRPEAHIVDIASMGGFIPFPGQGSG